MLQYISTILYVHFGNSREEGLTSGVGNPCAPHPLKIPAFVQWSEAHPFANRL